LLRLRAHPLPEARECADAILTELRKVIPSFLTRVDREDRGVAHSRYLAGLHEAAEALSHEHLPPDGRGERASEVRLIAFDPDGEDRVLAHALWPHSGLPLADVRERLRALPADRRAAALGALAGDRTNRRHMPGRALETTTYTFEIVCDYGAYRDLQRHRMLTLQAQPLTPELGYEMPADVADASCADAYAEAQVESAALYRRLVETHPAEASYAVTLAHRLRFCMTLNAREAMHLIELRSQPQGHESYRRVAQEMHRQIGAVAGHRAIAESMRFVDHTRPAAGRMDAEVRSEGRRPAAR
jgi:thymidylate synthase ThyX